MENDTSLSKNSQVKYLLDKFQQSEETTIEDLKILDGFVKEGKKNHKDISDASKKPKEVIELKEDKPNNNDDQENQNINEENKDIKLEFLNKSNIFEKGLRDRTSTDSSMFKKNFGRISLTDNFNKKSLCFNKQSNTLKDNIEESNKKEANIDEIKNAKKEKENENNDINEENKFYNININEEYSKNKNNENNNEIKEEIEDSQSNYQEKIINNSQTKLSETHLNNSVITQSSYAVKSSNFINMIPQKKNLNICRESTIYIEPIIANNNYDILSEKKVNKMEFIDNMEPKDKLINSINNNIIDNIENIEDLKVLEKHVEILLRKVRCKLGNDGNDPVMEKMIEKYFKLIIDKINNKKE